MAALEKLRIKDLCFYQKGPINFFVKPSECVGITGPSGIGKSLLLRAIADIDPHTGFVYLEGVESRDVRAPEWRKKVSLLPAESSWWFETVAMHFDHLDPHALGAMGFQEDVRTWEVRRMSSGERQRMALLRVLANRSKIFLLDEPTASLDAKNMDRVESFLDNYRRIHDVSFIWVSHDMAQLNRVADRCFIMESSHLREI